MKEFAVETAFGVTNCVLSVKRYANNQHIALSLFCEDGPFASITVNLPETRKYPKNCGFVDVNNFPEAENLIAKLGIGKSLGRVAFSGFCCYPLYEFDEDRIAQYVAREERA